MADQGFMASTLSFGGTVQSQITSITWSDDAGEVDVTSAADTVKVAVNGPRAIKLNVGVVGHSQITGGPGLTGAVIITWNDTTVTDGLGASLLQLRSVNVKGQVGGAITSELVFSPYSSS